MINAPKTIKVIKYLYKSTTYLILQLSSILACITNGGEKPDSPCIFPWTYTTNGRTYKYDGCANPHNDPRGDWCPTKLDENDAYVPKSGNWGYCNDKCKKDKGTPASWISQIFIECWHSNSVNYGI